MEIYCGQYGHVPYIIQIGWKNIYILFYENEIKVKAITDEDSDILWKLNKKSIKYQSPKQLLDLFQREDAYANATFRHFCGGEQ